MIHLIAKHDTPARWYCPVKGGWILIRSMEDNHILNAIDSLLQRKGHIHRKLGTLVAEAVRRRLPLPDHKWVAAFTPEGYTPKEGWVHVTSEIPLGEAVGKRIVSVTCIDEFGAYNPALRD